MRDEPFIDLDNNATTRPHPEVIELVAQLYRDCYANPGSRHLAGRRARQVLVDGRDALLARPDQFTRTMVERMLTYASGRSLTPSDMPAVRAMVRDVKASGYRFSALVMAVVQSAPFQMRTVGGAPELTASR